MEGHPLHDGPSHMSLGMPQRQSDKGALKVVIQNGCSLPREPWRKEETV